MHEHEGHEHIKIDYAPQRVETLGVTCKDPSWELFGHQRARCHRPRIFAFIIGIVLVDILQEALTLIVSKILS